MSSRLQGGLMLSQSTHADEFGLGFKDIVIFMAGLGRRWRRLTQSALRRRNWLRRVSDSPHPR